jgi:hypothetical protein
MPSESAATDAPLTGANKPVHSIRKHSLKATIWRNPTRNGPIFNVVLIRTFKNGEEFRDTTSLGFDDLANAAKLFLDAESWITNRIQREKSDGKPVGEPAGGASTAPTAAKRRGRKESERQ